ncbi:ribosome maturation factor RimP [Clostridium cylindrosporum]|uniref:Ribosome maturation factor RimP n=1 Tax=Clostridium cylindrosporum DSM 605 TaxID=1121307 RepID=A0A0J8DFX2_CLOCY|nr:ribosome maturation factor RimP [Clostridium cylindrosporum]KMT23068.1 ribosome maturation factor RimP [Clostridium cylindrosporum DSM 605]
MSKKNIELTIEEFASPLVEGLGYELVDIEFIKESGEWYLRFYIDSDNSDGINIDDCTTVSRALSAKLDEVDPIEESYYLEVSSPGLDRPLKKDTDFIKYSGKKIKIKFYKPFMEKKVMEGILKGLVESKIIVTVNNTDIEIDKDIVASVRLNDF